MHDNAPQKQQQKTGKRVEAPAKLKCDCSEKGAHSANN